MNKQNTLTLWRPVGLAEYRLLQESDMQAWPPRLPEQPIFYPVLNRAYAAEIAQKWNTKDSVSGFVGIVTEFEVDEEYASRFDREVVGAGRHEELWVPAEELEEFNAQIIGPIRVVDVFYGEDYSSEDVAGFPRDSRRP